MNAPYSSVVGSARDRTGNDPIFIWAGEARSRALAGDDVVNATIGALTQDDGILCTLPTVLETLRRLQTYETAGYAPISGLPAFRKAVVHDLFGDGPLASQAVAVTTPGGTGAVYQAVANFLEQGQKMLVPSFFWAPTAKSQRTEAVRSTPSRCSPTTAPSTSPEWLQGSTGTWPHRAVRWSS